MPIPLNVRQFIRMQRFGRRSATSQRVALLRIALGVLVFSRSHQARFNGIQKWHSNCYTLWAEHVEAFNSNKNSERTNKGGHTMAEWNPWQTLDTLRREIDRVFNETGSRS